MNARCTTGGFLLAVIFDFDFELSIIKVSLVLF